MFYPKIIADIRIPQWPFWASKVDYLQLGTGKYRTISMLGNFLSLSRKYDLFITADIKTAQIFGLFKAIFRLNKPRQIVLELMLDEVRKDIRWKLKKHLQRFCFSSVDVIFVSSRREVETYSRRLGLPVGRVRFLPFHTNIVEPKMIESPGGYILSAGRTGRDYVTLAAAVEGLATKVVVVSDKYHVADIHFPPNVQVFCDIDYDRYLELLFGCSMVIVPLKKLVKSTGQVVFLEAMALGKPVVATHTIGTEDYIEHGVTGLLVHPEDSDDLRKAMVALMDDSSLCAAIATRALEEVRKKNTFDVYTRTILETAKEICNRN